MDEIRFNQPARAIPEISAEDKKSRKSSSKVFFGIIKTIFKVALVLALLYGAIIGSKYLLKAKNGEIPDRYSAVFLTNGQVYFGKIYSNDKESLVLKDVYYLQSQTGNPQSPDSSLGSQFTLIKMGQEIHGPEDELFINKNQIMFYENLRDDSGIVQSINKIKK